jgi:adenine-specific DNA-methyltransferase
VGWTKDIAKFHAGRQSLTEQQLAEFTEIDSRGRKCRLLGLRKRGALSRRQDRPNLHFPIYLNPRDNAVAVDSAKGWVKVIPRLSDGSDGVWRWQKSKVTRDSRQLVARQVRRRDSGEMEWDVFQLDPVDNEAGEEKGRVFPSIWQGSEYNNETGRDQLRALFDAVPFEYPKPLGLLLSILGLVGDPNALVLDSFSGSGTTGQATLQANERDGGSRRFVLIQQECDSVADQERDNNICKNVTSERIRRAVCAERDAKAVPMESFSYARLGDPLFGEYKDFGDKLPAYEDIAKYVFYTETSHEFPGTTKKQNPAWDKKAGRIGEHTGRSYYLLYEPNDREDRGLDRKFLNDVASKDPNNELVVYCERLAVHQDELRKFHREHGKRIRHMLVPFNLK